MDESTRGYQQEECGPWGVSLTQELDRTMRTNTAFSQFAWESAKQEGCHYPCPERSMPSWPPCGKFIYPTLQKNGTQKVIGATNGENRTGGCARLCNEVPTNEYGSLQPSSGADMPWQQQRGKGEESSVLCEETNGLFDNGLTCAMKRAQDFLRNRPKPSAPAATAAPAAPAAPAADISSARAIAKSILQIEGSQPQGYSGQPQGYGGQPPQQQKAWAFGSSASIGETTSVDDELDSYLVGEEGDHEDEASSSSAITDDQYTIKNLFPCILNTYSGIAYDVAHWKELPVNGADDTARFIFLRDDRYKYVTVSILIVLFVLLLLAAIIMTLSTNQ